MLATSKQDMQYLENIADFIDREITKRGDGGEYYIDIAEIPDFPKYPRSRERVLGDVIEILSKDWLDEKFQTIISVVNKEEDGREYLYVNRAIPKPPEDIVIATC